MKQIFREISNNKKSKFIFETSSGNFENNSAPTSAEFINEEKERQTELLKIKEALTNLKNELNSDQKSFVDFKEGIKNKTNESKESKDKEKFTQEEKRYKELLKKATEQIKEYEKHVAKFFEAYDNLGLNDRVLFSENPAVSSVLEATGYDGNSLQMAQKFTRNTIQPLLKEIMEFPEIKKEIQNSIPNITQKMTNIQIEKDPQDVFGNGTSASLIEAIPQPVNYSLISALEFLDKIDTKFTSNGDFSGNTETEILQKEEKFRENLETEIWNKVSTDCKQIKKNKMNMPDYFTDLDLNQETIELIITNDPEKIQAVKNKITAILDQEKNPTKIANQIRVLDENNPEDYKIIYDELEASIPEWANQTTFAKQYRTYYQKGKKLDFSTWVETIHPNKKSTGSIFSNFLENPKMLAMFHEIKKFFTSLGIMNYVPAENLRQKELKELEPKIITQEKKKEKEKLNQKSWEDLKKTDPEKFKKKEEELKNFAKDYESIFSFVNSSNLDSTKRTLSVDDFENLTKAVSEEEKEKPKNIIEWAKDKTTKNPTKNTAISELNWRSLLAASADNRIKYEGESIRIFEDKDSREKFDKGDTTVKSNELKEWNDESIMKATTFEISQEEQKAKLQETEKELNGFDKILADNSLVKNWLKGTKGNGAKNGAAMLAAGTAGLSLGSMAVGGNIIALTPLLATNPIGWGVIAAGTIAAGAYAWWKGDKIAKYLNTKKKIENSTNTKTTAK